MLQTFTNAQIIFTLYLNWYYQYDSLSGCSHYRFKVAGIHQVAVNFITFLAAVSSSFFANAKFTFKADATSKLVYRQCKAKKD
jgi:hypothetical protein